MWRISISHCKPQKFSVIVSDFIVVDFSLLKSKLEKDDSYLSLVCPGVGDGQGSLVCCSPWGHEESDMTE